MGVLRGLLQEAAAILLPTNCAGCGLENRRVCADCLESVSAVGQSVNGLERLLPSGEPVTSAFEYSGRAAALLVAFKQQGTPRLARTFRPALEATIASAIQFSGSLGEPRIELVAVPSTSASDRKRGFNPVKTLLEAACLRYSEVLSSSIRESQKQLGVQDRLANLRNSMRARFDLTDRTFLLVDDIVTTGASLTEAARAIHSAGGRVVACATLASTLKKKSHDSNFA